MQRLPARNFQDLIVWQKAHQFVLSVYRITKAFPREEIYGCHDISPVAEDVSYIVRRLTESLKNSGGAHATANTHCHHSITSVAALQLAQDRRS